MRIKNVVVSYKMPKKFDFVLHLAVLILVTFGFLMIISTSVGNAGDDSLAPVKAGVKQGIFCVISYVMLLFFANNFTMVRAKKLLPVLGMVMMGMLLSTQFFTGAYGSKAWLQFHIAGQAISIQPTEFAKLFMIIVMGVYIEIAGRNNWDFFTIMKGPLFYFFICFVPIMLQRDMGTLLVFLVLPCICFLVPSHKNLRKAQKYMKVLIVVGVIAAFALMSDFGVKIFKEIEPLSHIATRIENASDPFLDPYGTGYQPINGLYGIASGGILGKGLGQSTQKYGYLTQSDSDYILAIVIEELGLIGFGIILLCYCLIIQRLFYYALHTKSEGYKIILIGSAFYIFIHFVLNVGGVSGLIPLTGVPLLFISSGGSSLISVMSAIGVSQAIISRIRRQGTIRNVKKEPQGVRGSLRKGRGETKIGG